MANPNLTPTESFVPQNAFSTPSPGIRIGNANLNELATGIEGVANRVAANFAPDPRVRAERQAGLQQQSAQQTQLAQAQIQASVERFKAFQQVITANAAQLNGVVPPKLQQAIDQETKLLSMFLQQAGMDPSAALQQREMTLAGAQVPGAQGEGFSLSPGAVRFDAAGNPIAAVPAAEPSGYSLAPGSTRYDAQGQPIVTAPGQPGGVNIQFGAGAFAPVQASRVTELQDQVQTSEGNLSEIRRTLSLFGTEAGQAAAGVSGVIADTVGGYSKQLLGTEGAFGPLGGPPLEDVTAVRTNAVALVGRLLPAITGDASGRYTERDQQRAAVASKALDPSADVTQVQAALKELEQIEVRANARDRVALAGVDLRSREGIIAYAKELARLTPGLDPDKAVDEALQDLGLNFQ